jgi:hypothetical protein
MRLDRALNIVLSIQTEAGDHIYVHSTPLSREVFRRYFVVIGKTFAELFSGGFSVIAGPGLAYLMLEKVALEMGEWEGPEGVQNGLVNELIRLSSVMIATKDEGWKSQPLHTAIQRKLLGADEIDEVLSELVFFMCVHSVNKRESAAGIMRNAHSLWLSQATHLGSTEFLNTLQISTEAPPENTQSDSGKTS